MPSGMIIGRPCMTEGVVSNEGMKLLSPCCKAFLHVLVAAAAKTTTGLTVSMFQHLLASHKCTNYASDASYSGEVLCEPCNDTDHCRCASRNRAIRRPMALAQRTVCPARRLFNLAMSSMRSRFLKAMFLAMQSMYYKSLKVSRHRQLQHQTGSLVLCQHKTKKALLHAAPVKLGPWHCIHLPW